MFLWDKLISVTKGLINKHFEPNSDINSQVILILTLQLYSYFHFFKHLEPSFCILSPLPQKSDVEFVLSLIDRCTEDFKKCKEVTWKNTDILQGETIRITVEEGEPWDVCQK